MRRGPLWNWLVLLAFLPSGCGGKFDLPTEHTDRVIPTDKSYTFIKSWDGLVGLKDVILTQGQGNQLFMLFNPSALGIPGVPSGPPTPRGWVRLCPITRPDSIGAPYFEPLRTLFNPVALTSGTNKLFVLDQGDSCQAKFDVLRATCAPDGDTTRASGHPFRNKVFDYSAMWRVREYGLGGGDTLSTFTDTTVAQPFGIAADEQGRVYVSGLMVVLDTNQTNPNIRTRKFVSRVFRYSRGPRYPGIFDVNMPGTTSWHRDTSWVVLDGSGASSISDPRGIYWSRIGVNPLFIADRGNNQVKGVSSNAIGVSVVRTDGQATGVNIAAIVQLLDCCPHSLAGGGRDVGAFAQHTRNGRRRDFRKLRHLVHRMSHNSNLRVRESLAPSETAKIAVSSKSVKRLHRQFHAPWMSP